jgi:hypothetical protein
MAIKSGVYEPPKAGLPYLAVVIVDGEISVLPASTPLEAARLLRDELKPTAKSRQLLNREYGSRKRTDV